MKCDPDRKYMFDYDKSDLLRVSPDSLICKKWRTQLRQIKPRVPTLFVCLVARVPLRDGQINNAEPRNLNSASWSSALLIFA